MASIRSGIGEDKDMYCNGTCKYLNERKHKCELTGEKLSHMKQAGSLSFAVHEHREICKFDNPELLEIVIEEIVEQLKKHKNLMR